MELRTRPYALLFSFFSGAGFLDLGFEQSGYEVVYFNEFDPAFVEGYEYARKRLGIAEPRFGKYVGSVTDLLPNGTAHSDLVRAVASARATGIPIGFIGGPPCPDFSVGGKNRGREGENGKLTTSYMELIREFQPDFFLFENVKGLWRTKVHRAYYEEIKSLLDEAGYALVDRLTNSIEYGAPQDRDRIIMIGFNRCFMRSHLKRPDAESEVINDMVHQFPWQDKMLYPDREAFDFSWPAVDQFQPQSKLERPKGVPERLTVEHWFKQNRVTTHSNAQHYFQPRQGLPRFQTIAEGDDSRKSFKRLHRNRYSPTAAYGNNEVHLHPYEVRRISVAEALAIQTLPKGFELPDTMTLSDMFKTVGNGVPYVMGVGLAETLSLFVKWADMRLTAQNLVDEISKLDTSRDFEYLSGKNKVRFIRVDGPEGPIIFERDGTQEAISTAFIWRMANALSSGMPVHVDALYQGGGNARSAFETLLLYTPHVYHCRPIRHEYKGGTYTVNDTAKRPKHIYWDAEQTHRRNEMAEGQTDMIVSTLEVQFVQHKVQIENQSASSDMSPEELRTHVLRQFQLAQVAAAFGMKAAIPANDAANKVQGHPLSDSPNIVTKLTDHPAFSSPAVGKAVNTAKWIDCLWLDFEENNIPLVFEVEHSTGIESGLTRMLKLKNDYKMLSPRHVIVAPDEDRDKVIRLADQKQYADLNLYFLPYSKLDELSAFVARDMMRGVTLDFMLNFMEKCPQKHRNLS